MLDIVRVVYCCKFHGRHMVCLCGFHLPVVAFRLEEALAEWADVQAEVSRL